MKTPQLGMSFPASTFPVSGGGWGTSNIPDPLYSALPHSLSSRPARDIRDLLSLSLLFIPSSSPSSPLILPHHFPTKPIFYPLTLQFPSAGGGTARQIRAGARGSLSSIIAQCGRDITWAMYGAPAWPLWLGVPYM